MLIKVCGVSDEITARQIASSSYVDIIGIVLDPKSVRHVSDLEQIRRLRMAAEEFGVETWGVFTFHTAERVAEVVMHTGINGVQLHGVDSRMSFSKASWHVSEHQIQQCRRIWVRKVAADGSIVSDLSHELKNFMSLQWNVSRDFQLFDGLEPGSGIFFDWAKFSRSLEDSMTCSKYSPSPRSSSLRHSSSFFPHSPSLAELLPRCFVAGGLNPENVDDVDEYHCTGKLCFNGTKSVLSLALWCLRGIGGVDVSSGVETPKGSGNKDIARVEQFSRRVRQWVRNPQPPATVKSRRKSALG